MKKLLFWILGVLGVLIIADISVGLISGWYVRNHDLGGDYTSFSHLVNSFNEEGLVLGSSTALNSIDTKKLSDSLNVSFFNGASNGQTIPFYLTALQTAMRNKKPEYVLLGINVNDLIGKGMGDRYNFLVPYYGTGNQGIDEGLEKMSPKAKYLLKSNLYRFNTIWFRILLYHFITPNEVGENGFIAKPIPAEFPQRNKLDLSSSKVTEERLSQLKTIIDLCRDNGIKLITFVPPTFVTYDNLAPIRKSLDSICNANNVPIYNDLYLEPFNSDSTLFFDNAHLNHNGAKIYSDLMIKRLRQNK